MVIAAATQQMQLTEIIRLFNKAQRRRGELLFGTCQGWSTLVKQQLELIEKKWRLLDAFCSLLMASLFFSLRMLGKSSGAENEEMLPENVLLLLMSMEINRAGSHWHGSGRLNPTVQGCSGCFPILWVLLALPRALPLTQ